MVYLMESYIKTVTLVCVWRIGKEIAEEEREYRDLSVGLDGYMKVYDYGRMKVWRCRGGRGVNDQPNPRTRHEPNTGFFGLGLGLDGFGS
ncbi:hypothetical protein SO802_015999 [Lithocarpus litseifolius]|uniref:Uncharacterized protein n=1 Tax=Lithocarpus litseifolius TaxID=425828 RepID=A0AAW2CXF1_9ROSI